jgi:hypothetical protein
MSLGLTERYSCSMASRRCRYDALAPATAPRWLVEQDLHRNVLTSHYLEPGADLRAVLAAAIASRQAAMAGSPNATVRGASYSSTAPACGTW